MELTTRESLLPVETIQQRILAMRGQRVMLSTDLAALYGVEPRALVQAVKRNLDRFPPDFMFQLTKEEQDVLRSQNVTLRTGQGQYSKYLPLMGRDFRIRQHN